jgi:hypothetical protein
MLIVCNGAFKSGSTWLYNIIKSTIPSKPIPQEFHADAQWHGDSIAIEKIPLFLEKVDYKNVNYIFKSHYGDLTTRDILLSHDHVYCLNITRDIRDVIVSAYYHFIREDGIKRPFEDYYWVKGRTLIEYVYEYHLVWPNIEGKIYVSSYERLNEDFDNEAQRIFDFLNYTLTPEKLKILRAKTSLQESRRLWKEDSKKPEDCFFRKGIVGDWENHFTPAIEEDYNNVMQTTIKKFIQ